MHNMQLSTSSPILEDRETLFKSPLKHRYCCNFIWKKVTTKMYNFSIIRREINALASYFCNFFQGWLPSLCQACIHSPMKRISNQFTMGQVDWSDHAYDRQHMSYTSWNYGTLGQTFILLTDWLLKHTTPSTLYKYLSPYHILLIKHVAYDKGVCLITKGDCDEEALQLLIHNWFSKIRRKISYSKVYVLSE